MQKKMGLKPDYDAIVDIYSGYSTVKVHISRSETEGLIARDFHELSKQAGMNLKVEEPYKEELYYDFAFSRLYKAINVAREIQSILHSHGQKKLLFRHFDTKEETSFLSPEDKEE